MFVYMIQELAPCWKRSELKFNKFCLLNLDNEKICVGSVDIIVLASVNVHVFALVRSGE